ncbi:MAG: protein kinase, partial [Deltaproteobacteria bacterium]|nr:protein kinase [Deltaproteobacteria bacterium]
VPVFDAGLADGEIFLAMDFVEGKDLRAVWNRCAKKAVAFPVDVAAFIVKELCRGLGYAHGFGDLKLVHRDVSPPNVLLSFAGEVKLTDFGLASSTLKMEKTAPGVIYGKVSYMSPEQARGEPLDGRTDLYAAGIILWELLTGRQLFPPGQAQAQDLLSRAKDPRPAPPSERAPRVPGDLDEIVLKALSPASDDRYQTGEELRAALAGWLAREAPETDSDRLARFVMDLFAEDLQRERAEREELVRKTSEQAPAPTVAAVPDTSVRAAASESQRALTRPGTPRLALRIPPLPPAGAADEKPSRGKLSPVPERTRRGVGAPAPPPRPDMATIVQPGSGNLATSAALLSELETSDTTWASGQLIDGRYRIRSLIGEGGMGRVYEAEHVEIGKRVALKILHPAFSRTPDVVARFRREARAASKIGHPNIVDVTDSGTTADGSVYFVMEFLEGVELAAVIAREGALEIQRALHIASQMCRALAAAHNAGIIHRDLKPENVFLVVREGTPDFVKVLDFGIAKSAELEEQRNERLTHPGMAMGTPEYMAPEQAAGKPADARSDVYAVGAIVYEMLTGAPPYQGENFMEILTKKATREPTPPGELRKDLPEIVEKLVLRSLARSPEDRPPSMEAFEYELTKCLAGRGVAVAKMLGMSIDPGLLVAQGLGAEPVQGNRAAVGESPLMTAEPAREVGAASANAVSQRRRFMRRSFALALLLVGGAYGAYLYVNSDPEEPARTARRVAPGRREQEGRASRSSPSRREAGEEHPGERRARSSSVKPSVASPSRETPSSAEKGPKTEPPSPVTAGQQPPKPPSKVTRPEPPPRVEKPVDKAVPVERAERPLGPPRDRREAETLLDDAQAAEAKMRWTQARGLYERVAKGKYSRARGLLGLANVAFQTKDTDTAILHAKSSLAAGGGDQARMLLGHALYKKGDYDDAIEQYQVILKRSPGNKEAQRALREAEKQRKR